MPITDILFILHWWIILFLIGGIFFPLTSYIFPSFTAKGYLFSKIIGILLITYTMYLLATLHILPFNIYSLLSIGTVFLAINIFLARKQLIEITKILPTIIIQESIFIIMLFGWSFIRAHEPNIHGLEKFMDMGFVNSILRSTYFPPKDMWYAGSYINYYYFGHIATAVLTKLSGITPFITFNLMIATLFALGFTESFAIGLELVDIHKLVLTRKKVIVAVLAGTLAMLGGNLHVLYAFFTAYPANNPLPFWKLTFAPLSFPNNYWYPDATRFIPYTIHEFPSYSFVVSDLHGHVLDIPIVMLFIALLYSSYKEKRLQIKKLVMFGMLLAVEYMTNAWDMAIYFLLSFAVFSVLEYYNPQHFSVKSLFTHKKRFRRIITAGINVAVDLGILVVSWFIFSLPFNWFLQPPLTGIGVMCAPQFLINIHAIGPFLFEANKCQHSTWWELATLYGFFYFFAGVFFVYLFKQKKYQESDMFILLLILVSTLLLITPEFIYLKDIYPQYFRANTMFKLAYQAFMLLSIASAYIIFLVLKRIRNIMLTIITLLLIIIVMCYPYFAVSSYYNHLSTYEGLNGFSYLSQSYPSDYRAILWINSHITGQPVMLEAQGDSYTDYDRVSAYTGLPTIMGWTVHEWLWRGSYQVIAPRINEVKTIYEGSLAQAIPLLLKYHVQYVYVGRLEREKYPNLNQEKFLAIGSVVYEYGNVTIYRLDSSLLKG